MSISQIIMMGPENLTQVDAADFDGINDYMTRGASLTGAADSKKGIFSAWIRLDGGDGTAKEVLANSTTVGGFTMRFQVLRTVGNKFQITGVNEAAATILLMDTAATYTASATWLHLLSSWDLSSGGASHIYMNDISDKSVTTFTNDSIEFTVADWSIGAQPNGGRLLDAALAELYFAPGQYLDFSQVNNRRKFISTGGNPIHLGVTGTAPTGTAPLVYQHLDDAEAVANFATNRGTGGNFTITGTLATASTSPSD